MTLRVLHAMAGAEFGGAETAFIDLLAALKKAGIEQRAVIREHSVRAALLKDLDIPTVQVPFKKWFDWTSRQAIRREAAAFAPHVVQSWMDRAASMTPRLPAVQVGWWGGYYKTKYYRNCDYIVGVTPDIVASAIAQGWPVEKTAVLRTFSVEEHAVPLDRSLFSTPEDAPLLLGLGRLHSDKAFDIILEALVKIPDAYLWIAGDGVLREELPNLARKLGVMERVRFLGWRADRAALLKTCDVCVYPSRVEPFGTVMVEAWAYRAPLVTAASKGPKAHVRDKENGLIIPIDDVDALVLAIQRVLKDPQLAKKIVEGGWRDYQMLFTEDAVVAQYLAFYHHIIPVKERWSRE